MSNQLDWQFDELEDEDPLPLASRNGSTTRHAFWFIAFTAVLTIALLLGWQYSQTQLAAHEQKLQSDVQRLLDAERQAYHNQDGDLFFLFFAGNPEWQAAQLLPENQTIYRNSARVTRVQQQTDTLWANLSWQEGEATWQRVAFFQQQGNQLRHVASLPDYWGVTKQHRLSWGTLSLYELDAGWIAAIDEFVTQTLADHCLTDCNQPLNLIIADDYRETAVSGTIRVPSPRILALDDHGQPAPQFWTLLEQRLRNQIQPITIRYALLPAQYPLMDYEKLAAEFMASHPDIVVELVQLESLPDDLQTLAIEFDGVAMVPPIGLVTAGLVYDLTPLATSDPAFATTDFYEQIWAGAQWRERMWFMPQAAAMSLIYYDKTGYSQANLPEPSLRWTWDEMNADLSRIVTAQPETSELEWAFMDISNDALFSYAFNWGNRCQEAAVIFCLDSLTPQDITAAFEWYQQLAAQHDRVLDLNEQTPGERIQSVLNVQSSRRRVAVWVDDPVTFEHYLLLSPIGVVPFPGSDRFDGITPLRLEGGFISQQSAHPIAVWQWLDFLSHHPTQLRTRLVPARPSVATQSRYWNTLPQSLGEAMRVAFPFSRPVMLDEQLYFASERITAVLAGQQTPAEAARQARNIRWFMP